jgi:putative spermidine/putrescine transport system permease protein
LRWYDRLLHARDWHAAFGFSILLGGITAAIALVVGAVGAFGLVRGKMPARRAIFMFALMPVVIPEIILALALYFFEAGIRILGTLWGLTIGHVALALPYVLIVMSAAIRGLNPDLEHAAAVHGARPYQTLRRLLIPLLRPSLLTSAFLAFLVSFDLLVISIFLIGRQPPTLPLKFWADIKFETDPTLSAASSVIITGVILCVGVAQWWRYRASSDARISG